MHSSQAGESECGSEDGAEDPDGAVDVLYVRYLEAALGAFLAQAACHGVLAGVGQDGAECLALIIRAVGVADKEQAHAAGFEVDCLDAKFTAHTAQGDKADKLDGLLGNLAETVLQAVAEALYVLLELHAVKLAVQKDTLAAVGHE